MPDVAARFGEEAVSSGFCEGGPIARVDLREESVVIRDKFEDAGVDDEDVVEGLLAQRVEGHRVAGEPPVEEVDHSVAGGEVLAVGLSTVGTTLHSVVVTCPLIAVIGIETVCERANRRIVYRSS